MNIPLILGVLGALLLIAGLGGVAVASALRPILEREEEAMHDRIGCSPRSFEWADSDPELARRSIEHTEALSALFKCGRSYDMYGMFDITGAAVLAFDLWLNYIGYFQ